MPRLPNADRAVIPERKLRDYLLSETHPVGRYKAAWLAGLGHDADDWPRLDADLREQHLIVDAEPVGDSRFGRKYRIDAPLVGPPGVEAPVVSIWIMEHGKGAPRLVTPYPGTSP